VISFGFLKKRRIFDWLSEYLFGEISGYQGVGYEDGCLVGCLAV
jgi:hypothetical protein